MEAQEAVRGGGTRTSGTTFMAGLGESRGAGYVLVGGVSDGESDCYPVCPFPAGTA
jgi:hypothetical protein